MFSKGVVLLRHTHYSGLFMKVFRDVAGLRQYITKHRTNLDSLGLVPTMGALHQGHVSLIRASKKENEITVCSIYVNPTQFNNQSDLTNYPRRLEEDMSLLEKEGCDILFLPQNEEMYPEAPALQFHFGNLEKTMEGKFRNGHFNGVGIIVSKLLHIVAPNKAYFGQKDIQQFFIVQQLVKDLSFPVALIRVETLREPDGLALSSRNLRLSPSLRKKAPLLYKALVDAGELLKIGKPAEEIKAFVKELFTDDKDFKLEYIELADGDSLDIITHKPKKGEVFLCAAAYLGDVRLIDNISIIL